MGIQLTRKALDEWSSHLQFINVKGHKVCYRREGSGPFLLCIHGFPTSCLDFFYTWEGLIQRYDVIAIDLIGLGQSAKPQIPLSIAFQADIIEKFLSNLDIKKVHILAHDLGDTVAQELLARQSLGVGKINWLSCVLMNGGIFPETHRPLLIQKLLISPLGSVVARLTSKATFRRNMRTIFAEHSPPEELFLEESWRLLTLNHGKKMIPRLIRYMKERQDNRERWVEPLVKKAIPIRLINGILDPISGVHVVQRYRELVKEPDIVEIDAGHYPHVEAPYLVLSAVYAFHETHSKFRL